MIRRGGKRPRDLTEQGSATPTARVRSRGVHRITRGASAGKRTQRGITRSSSLRDGRGEMNEHRSCGESDDIMWLPAQPRARVNCCGGQARLIKPSHMEEKNGAHKPDVHDSLPMATFPPGNKDGMKREIRGLWGWGVGGMEEGGLT